MHDRLARMTLRPLSFWSGDSDAGVILQCKEPNLETDHKIRVFFFKNPALKRRSTHFAVARLLK